MSQPIKKTIVVDSNSNKKQKSKQTRKRRLKKKPIVTRKVTIKDDGNVQHTTITKIEYKEKRNHPEYGTSKLEQRFAKDFLDKIGVRYVYQFKMESIGRYADFYLPDENVCIEIDGDYYHSYGLLYEQMSPMQKKNYRVDRQKDRWCMINCIKMIRIWEHDINNSPQKVMKLLETELYSARLLKEKINNKKRRH